MKWVSLCALLVACPGPEPEPWEDPFAPRTTPSLHTGCDDTACPRDDPFEARHIFIEAQFGYDAPTGAAVTTDLAGYTSVPPAYFIYLAEVDWQRDLNSTDKYCYIMLPFDHAGPWSNSSFDPWDTRLYGGVQYDIEADPPVSNCGEPGWELEPDLWGNNVVRDFVRSYSGNYFQAVGYPTERILAEVVPQFPPELQDHVIGGALGVPSFLGTRVDEIYGFAWKMDEHHTVELDVTGYLESLPRTEVKQGDSMVSAYYDLRSYIYWSLE